MQIRLSNVEIDSGFSLDNYLQRYDPSAAECDRWRDTYRCNPGGRVDSFGDYSVTAAFYFDKEAEDIQCIVLKRADLEPPYADSVSHGAQEVRFRLHKEMLESIYGAPSEEGPDYVLYQFEDGEIRCVRARSGGKRYSDGYVYIYFYSDMRVAYV